MSHFSDKNHLGGGPHPERRKREGRSERARLALRPSAMLPRENFLPVDRADMDARGWDRVDVLLVSGDAYVDHPSFGVALLGRWLEAHGFRVGIVPQPRWDSPDDIIRLGRPRLFAGVTAGAVDSMLAHYTAFRKKRLYPRRPGRSPPQSRCQRLRLACPSGFSGAARGRGGDRGFVAPDQPL